MPLSTWLTVIGLGLTLVGAVLGATRGTLPPLTAIVASSLDDFRRRQRATTRWLRIGLWLIAAGTVLQGGGAILGSCAGR